MVSRRLAMDSITPMYDTASRKKSSGRSETVLLANCGETSCKVKKSFMCAATSMIYCTSKMAKLVRWLHMHATSVSLELVLLLIKQPSDDHPP